MAKRQGVSRAAAPMSKPEAMQQLERVPARTARAAEARKRPQKKSADRFACLLGVCARHVFPQAERREESTILPNAPDSCGGNDSGLAPASDEREPSHGIDKSSLG